MPDDSELDEFIAWAQSIPSLVEQRSHPNHWYNRASDLHASAGALWYAMEHGEKAIPQQLGLQAGFSMSVACRPVYLMLSGLALELIMKAVLVLRGAPLKQLETHSLRKLAEAIGPRPSNEEETLLRFYESFLVWAGRYPIPKGVTEEKLANHYSLTSDVLMAPAPEMGSTLFYRASGRTDWDEFSKLWGKYAALFSF